MENTIARQNNAHRHPQHDHSQTDVFFNASFKYTF